MKKNQITVLLSIVIVVLVLGYVFYSSRLVVKNEGKPSLLVYCGAGLRKPMEKIAVDYIDEFGTEVVFQFNGSGALSNQIKLSKDGDLYMPGDYVYVDQLKDVEGKNYIYKDKMIVYHTPVIVTPKENKAAIKAMNDLAREGVKVILGDESIAVGRLTEKMLKKANIYEQVQNNVVSKMATVNQVATDLALGQGDTGIIWYANYKEHEDDLSLIEIPADINIIKEISIGVLNFSNNLEEAERFMNYVATKGKDVFSSFGYKTIE